MRSGTHGSRTLSGYRTGRNICSEPAHVSTCPTGLGLHCADCAPNRLAQRAQVRPDENKKTACAILNHPTKSNANMIPRNTLRFLLLLVSVMRVTGSGVCSALIPSESFHHALVARCIGSFSLFTPAAAESHPGESRQAARSSKINTLAECSDGGELIAALVHV